MIIHFSILFLILMVSAFYEHRFRANKVRAIAEGGTASDYLGSIFPWLLVFGYIAFLAGMRSNVNDTYAYRESFINLQPSWDSIRDLIFGIGKDKCFSVLAMLFKMYISKDYHMWFLFIASIESLLIINVLRRETVSFYDCCLTLFATGLYFNYFTMMRQWIAVSIVFWASRFIKQRKFIIFLLVCLFAAQFHNSAYFMIPAYFIVTGRAFGKKQIALSVFFLFAILFLQPLLDVVDSLAGDSTYNYVISTMQTNTGSSWVRIPIAAAPLVLVYIYRKSIRTDYCMINIALNMSLLNVLLLALASVTSGIFVGRMSNYTQMYSLILFPYLLNITVKDDNKSLIKIIFYSLYFILYFVQMKLQGSFYYGSDVLGYFT